MDKAEETLSNFSVTGKVWKAECDTVILQIFGALKFR